MINSSLITACANYATKLITDQVSASRREQNLRLILHRRKRGTSPKLFVRDFEHVSKRLTFLLNVDGEKDSVASTNRFVNTASAYQNCCGDNFNGYNNMKCYNNYNCRRNKRDCHHNNSGLLRLYPLRRTPMIRTVRHYFHFKNKIRRYRMHKGVDRRQKARATFKFNVHYKQVISSKSGVLSSRSTIHITQLLIACIFSSQWDCFYQGFCTHNN